MSLLGLTLSSGESVVSLKRDENSQEGVFYLVSNMKSGNFPIFVIWFVTNSCIATLHNIV